MLFLLLRHGCLDDEAAKTVVATVFHFLPLRDLICIRSLSQSTYAYVDAYLYRTYSIEDTLSAYLESHETVEFFRVCMEFCGAVLSGHAVLAFLAREAPDLVIPLELYVDHKLSIFMGLLLIKNGFHYISEDEFGDSSCARLLDDWAYRRQRISEGSALGSFIYRFRGVKSLIYIRGTTRGILDAVLEQESSSLFNIVTGTEAYSIFPFSTFSEREPIGDNAQSAYKRADGKHQGMVALSGGIGREFQGPFRFLGDRSTWRFRLNPPVSLPVLSDRSGRQFPTALHSWVMRSNTSGVEDEYCMPHWLEIILTSYRRMALCAATNHVGLSPDHRESDSDSDDSDSEVEDETM
ncbi:hypothetical protein BT96DRAFT_998864 [Gymnopus androsaceus JB14]|uniref:Uncharacterized protein n=1 Tax=Gymnopus androsaceus JB14 TaxID=1447944 RepID=A0A6A4H8B8_9AGAR|nr:hypothetical protein BT96DRAFT_998864 [Gymnopus androsaceus JB14]